MIIKTKNRKNLSAFHEPAVLLNTRKYVVKAALKGIFSVMADEGVDQDTHQEIAITSNENRRIHFFGFTFPPSGFFGRTLTRGFIVLVSWAVLWSVLGDNSLPRGNIFGIFSVVVLSALGGFLTRKLSRDALPSLLGMLVVGFILRNVPGINVARHIDKKWSATLRSMALVVILTRSGLELDPGALRRLKFTVIRLAFSPCVGEAITVAIVGKFLINMPWLWGFQLGCVSDMLIARLHVTSRRPFWWSRTKAYLCSWN